jgi:hypothetical protein
MNDPVDNARVVVSQLVGSLVRSNSRSDMQDTLHFDHILADLIVKRVGTLVNMNLWSNVIVDGIRQLSIVEKVIEIYPEAQLIWLEVPVEERKRRYENRKDGKDSLQSFEVADNKPIELECQKIFDTLKDKLIIVNNY